ncbi:Ethanolamine kinase 1 [Myotis brandtii]|uniref:Ethanolamine kinase 1 n=1 Tax=Myotis brandtii TaxID=109478 RepID=S7NS60_MYOBR|nr:Ethanolamine kinase 1 [Myotis brandtii]
MANYIHVPSGSPEVPKLDVTVQDQEEQRCREGALSLLQHLRPHWDPQEVTLQVTPTPQPSLGPSPPRPWVFTIRSVPG